VRSLGSDRTRRVDVRVIAATHRDVPAMVAAGRFREDLFYRLAVVRIDLPRLRDRPEDLEPLVQHFLHKHAPGRDVEVDRHAMARLVRHDWPGNVRELENEIRRALVLADERIGVDHLSPALTADAPAPKSEPLDLRSHVDALERRLIRQALDNAHGNQTHAARMLGVSRFGLQKMLRRLGA
jgi:DNA-binding NtrC family response regulator